MFTVRTCWSNCLLIVVGCLTACGTSSNDLTDSRIERIDAALAQPDARDNAIDAAIVAPDAPVAFADSRIAMADAAAVAPDARIIDARIASSDAHISSPDARIPSPDARVVDASLSSPDGTLAIDATTPADAAYVPRCGNGIVDLDEQCDNGAANSNNGTCLLNCTVASCGDGFVESGVEVCDDGTNGPGTCCATDCSSHLTCSGGGINFSTGNISGSVVWNGQPITSPDLSQIYAVVFDSTTYIAYQQLSSDASYDFGSLPPGSYTLKLFSEGCFDAPDTIGQLSVTVIAGSAVAADLDITATAGRIVGNIALNDVALPSPVLSMATCGSNGFSGDSNGNFSYYLPPASYTATVANPSQTVVGTFPVTITAGNTTDVGAEEFTTGELRGSVIWNGQPIASPDLSQIYAVVFDSTTYIAYQQLSSDASYDFGSLPPGSYTLKLFSEGCFDAPDTIGQLSVTVIGQTTSTVDLDITATAGLIVGNIELNGVALPSPVLSMATCGSNGFSGDSNGNFSYYLPPASYTATVANPSQTVVGTFPVTITAGNTTDVGAEEFTTGELRGSVIWNGQPITSPDLSQIYAVVFDSTTYIAYQQLSSDASYDFGSLPPGSYTLKLFSEGCFDAPDTIGQLSVTVIGQTTSTVDLDITATAGRIVGNIELNGVALPSPTISIGTCGSNGFTGDSDGNFSYYLPPGSFTANVSNSSQTVVGSFPVTIAAGLSTEYDNAVTASGNNVSIAAAGGTSTVGGIQLIFASVTQAGTTTIIVSSEGPTAPDGLSIVGLDGAALYWAVSTTATFNGSIEVCVQYDPTQVNGPINTLNLVDVSNGFANITTSVNTSTNVICGATSTISTFAVIDQPF